MVYCNDSIFSKLKLKNCLFAALITSVIFLNSQKLYELLEEIQEIYESLLLISIISKLLSEFTKLPACPLSVTSDSPILIISLIRIKYYKIDFLLLIYLEN